MRGYLAASDVTALPKYVVDLYMSVCRLVDLDMIYVDKALHRCAESRVVGAANGCAADGRGGRIESRMPY
jgi:hypothetical protein